MWNIQIGAQTWTERAVELLVHLVDEYAAGKFSDVARGAETPRLAGLLMQKYGRGVVQRSCLIHHVQRTRSPQQSIKLHLLLIQCGASMNARAGPERRLTSVLIFHIINARLANDYCGDDSRTRIAHRSQQVNRLTRSGRAHRENSDPSLRDAG